MSKLLQQIQVVHSCQSQHQPIRCDFCIGDHPNSHGSYQNNSSEEEIIHEQQVKTRWFLQQQLS